jgi:hypothetical protein
VCVRVDAFGIINVWFRQLYNNALNGTLSTMIQHLRLLTDLYARFVISFKNSCSEIYSNELAGVLPSELGSCTKLTNLYDVLLVLCLCLSHSLLLLERLITMHSMARCRVRLGS